MAIRWRLLIKDVLLAPWRATKFVVGMIAGLVLLSFVIVARRPAVLFLGRYTTIDDPSEWYDDVFGEALVALTDWAVPGGLEDDSG